MLCDYLIHDKVLLGSYDGIEKTFAKITMAQKFILTKEFSIAADGFVDNYPELEKVVPFCRLPFPLMWIEWMHDDRPHWDQSGPYKARPVDKKRHQLSSLRIGLLLQQYGDNPGKWRAHLFWSLKEKPEGGTSEYNGSLAALDMDMSHPLDGVDISRFTHADFGYKLVESLPADIQSQLGEYALEDWGGEMRFMIAVIGLLNARNVVYQVPVDKERHNAKRIKNKQLPLFSHKLLKIKPEIYVRDWRDSQEQQHKDLRMHFVRGHFKHRKTGLFWWSMYVRGKQGFVAKDYEV